MVLRIWYLSSCRVMITLIKTTYICMHFIRNAQNLSFISVYSRNFITTYKRRRKFRNKLLIHSHFLPGIKAEFFKQEKTIALTNTAFMNTGSTLRRGRYQYTLYKLGISCWNYLNERIIHSPLVRLHTCVFRILNERTDFS